MNLISKYESFIHLGCFLGIFYVQFILLRTPGIGRGLPCLQTMSKQKWLMGGGIFSRGPASIPRTVKTPILYCLHFSSLPSVTGQSHYRCNVLVEIHYTVHLRLSPGNGVPDPAWAQRHSVQKASLDFK